MIVRELLLSLIGCLLTGCTTATDGLTTNRPAVDLSGPAVGAIAGDMVSRFAEQVGPEIDSVRLIEDASPFGQAMEAALKGWGYVVVTDEKIDEKKRTIALAYTVDDFAGQALVSISAGSVELARAYATSATGASPASAVSVRRN
ncbi:conjugal transfer protein TrbH (plasmid) [Rhizobium leguminosarum]